MSEEHSDDSPAMVPNDKPAAKKAAKKAVKKTAKKTAKKAAKKQVKAKVAEPKQSEFELKNEVQSPTVEKTEKPARAQEERVEQTERGEGRRDSETKRERNPNQNKNSENSDRSSNDEGRDDQQQRPQRRGRVKGGGRVHQDKRNQDNRNQNNRNQNNQKQNNKRRNPKNQNNNKRRNPREPREQQERKPVELTGPPVEVNGILELAPKGFGFLRVLSKGLEQSNNDVFISPDIVRDLGLRLGAWLHGVAKEGSRGLQMVEVTTVNGQEPDQAKKLPHFEELKAINPDKRISFETTQDRYTTRVVDIIAPIGRGQRGLIVSPPRSGKTTMMLHMAEAIQEKYEESLHLMVLLVDERPEEVTEFRQCLPEAEIYASSNDAGAKNHCRVAELCIERAKRLVEAGEHVFILMDSITRLARAYNAAMGGEKGNRGRGIQSGGIISGALEMPRRIFAAARNTRNAGSLTIVATALVHTNARADEAIFQEFKGTGNMELVLDRRIAEQYIYPAVDIFKSGTRREELLIAEHQLHKIHLIRRGLTGQRPNEAMERLLFFLKRFPNNAQMLLEIKG